jgi:hypothetical protein
LPQLKLVQTETEQDASGEPASMYHTHRTTTVAEHGNRARSVTSSIELPPMMQSARSGPRSGTLPPTPTLPPPLDLPALSSTLGCQMPQPQLLPFAPPTSPHRLTRHRLHPVSLSSDSVETTAGPPSPTSSSSSTSSSCTSPASKKLYRRTLSELLASQFLESYRQQQKQEQQQNPKPLPQPKPLPHPRPQQPEQQQQSKGQLPNKSSPVAIRHMSHNNNYHSSPSSPVSSPSPSSFSGGTFHGQTKSGGGGGGINGMKSGERLTMSTEMPAVSVVEERRNSGGTRVELSGEKKRAVGVARQQSMSTPSSPVHSSSPAPFLSPARRSASGSKDDEKGSRGGDRWSSSRRGGSSTPPPIETGASSSPMARREMVRMLELSLSKDPKKRVSQSPVKKDLERST